MVTIKHHHARSWQATVYDLSAMVSAGPAGRWATAGLHGAGVPESAAAAHTSQLAASQPGLRRRLPDRPSGQRQLRAAAAARAARPTSLGSGERPVRNPRSWFHWASRHPS